MRNILIHIFLYLFGLAAGATEPTQFKLSPNILNFSDLSSQDVRIEMTMPDGYHAFSDQFRIENVSPTEYEVSIQEIKKEIQFFDKFSKKQRKGIEKSGHILVHINPRPDLDRQEKLLKFNLRYQICSSKFCYLPQKKEFSLNLNFNKPVIAADQPQLVSSDTSDQSTLSKLQALFESALQHNLLIALALVFIAGILTSFTPCIFPMIPITISILGHDAEKNSRVTNFFRSLSYVLGIAFTYSTLGLVAAMTGKIFGNLLSSKWVIGFMVLLFFTMALSMWGVFDLQVPAFIRQKFGTSKTKSNYIGLFIMGLVSGIVASPCVGPVLVSILSYVSTTQDLFLGFILLFTYAIGLGLIFMVIGVFGQALSMLPKSGRWMNKIKFFLGLLMVLVGLYYLKFLIPTFDSQGKATQAIHLKNWVDYSEEHLNAGKPILIDFRADWCAACLEMEEKTFSSSDFHAISEKFTLVRVDATQETEANQAIIKKYDVKGLPTVLFINKKGELQKDLTTTQFLDWPKFKSKMEAALER